ncbi:MAG: hypothetical protein LC792_25925, partial [Actinobacteria bacterium]|nr:hypothetical protein [Actinomycetota bacterium]
GMLLTLFAGTALLARVAPRGGSAAETIRWDSLGAGSWEAARTGNGGRDILIKLIGGPEWKADNPCTVAYHVEVAETATQVRLRIGESSPPDRRPPPPSGSVYGCGDVGYDRSITAHLARPLGSRQVVEAQFDRIRPVFDGDSLATVGWLPDSWHQLSEGGSTNSGELQWSRRFGPDLPASAGNRCTPSDSGLVLSEGPVDRTGPPPAAGDDVHGTKASYQQYDPRDARLVWTEHDRLYIVASSIRCEGDTIPSKDTMLHFARSLRVP